MNWLTSCILWLSNIPVFFAIDIGDFNSIQNVSVYYQDFTSQLRRVKNPIVGDDIIDLSESNRVEFSPEVIDLTSSPIRRRKRKSFPVRIVNDSH